MSYSNMKWYKIILVLILPVFCISQDLTDGLLVHYKFENTYLDETPNNFDGTPIGTYFVEDRFGNPTGAVFFDGVDDFIEMPNDARLRPDFPLSFSLWINATTLVGGPSNTFGIFDNCFVENSYQGIFLAIPDNGNKALSLTYGDASGGTGPNNRRSIYATEFMLTENTWYHVVGIFNSPNDLQIYINGCNIFAPSNGNGRMEIGYSANPGNLGRNDHSTFSNVPIGYFNGCIDDFYYWNRTITKDEIDLLLNNYIAKPEKTITYSGCAGDGYEIVVSGNRYNELNPIGTVNVRAETGCDTLVRINLNFSLPDTIHVFYTLCPGDSLLVNGNNYQESGFFEVNEIDERGCLVVTFISIEEELCIPCDPSIYIPNMMTRSSINEETFAPLYSIESGFVQILELYIFDRWGNIVYNCDGTTTCRWDGTKHGKLLSKGIYTYRLEVLECSDTEKEYVGSILLLD